MFRVVGLMLAMILLAPVSMGDTAPEGAAPSRVVGGLYGNQVYLAWLPGAVVPDSFRVYGLSEGGGRTPLDEVEIPPDGSSVFTAVVPAGFTSYAISGVVSGAESQPMLAYFVQEECILEISWSPPGVSSCKVPGLPGLVKIRQP